MARGKLGGTKAKVRGQIGGEIYQVKRASDGTLMQSVYAKPESVEYSNTDAQAKARMIMGQIERMFKALPDVINDSYIKIPRGTLSFQHFSKINYPLLKDQVENHWDEIGDFDWRDKRDMTPPAGAWLLTDGTYHQMNYDSAYVSVTTYNDFYLTWQGVQWDWQVKDLLELLNLSLDDYIWFFYYMKKAPEWNPEIKVLKIRFNPDVHSNDYLEDIDLEDLWVSDTPNRPSFGFDLDGEGELRFIVNDFDRNVEYVVANGCLLILNANNGNTLFSTAQFEWLIARTQDVYPIKSPAQAFVSWQGEENSNV